MGFYVSHVKDLRAHNVTLRYEQEDSRPALFLNDVVDARIEGLDALISPKLDAAIVLEKVDEMTLAASTIRGGTRSLFKLIGDQNGWISAIGNNLTGMRNICEPTDKEGTAIISRDNQLDAK